MITSSHGVMLEFCPRQSYVTGIIKNTNSGFKLKEKFLGKALSFVAKALLICLTGITLFDMI